MVIFHSFLYVYQRVISPLRDGDTTQLRRAPSNALDSAPRQDVIRREVERGTAISCHKAWRRVDDGWADVK